MGKKKNGKALAAPAKGFKRIIAGDSPFWEPQKNGEHPNPIVGTYIGTRVMPARGKFPAQDVLDVLAEDGEYTIAVRGTLKRQVRAAQLGAGQIIRVEWTEKLPPSDDLPMGLNVYDLQVAE